MPSPVVWALFLVQLSVASPVGRVDQAKRPTLHRPRPAHIAPLTVRRSKGSYYVEAEVGTPGQVVNLQLRNDAGTTILVPSRNASCDAICNCTRSACKSVMLLFRGASTRNVLRY